MDGRRYWAHPYGKLKSLVGPFDTREQATAAAFDKFPEADEVTTGYGTYGPFFHIQWIRR